MPRYEVDELSFDVPDGYEDNSMNVFFPSSQAAGSFNITVSRTPRDDKPLAAQAQALLAELQDKLPGTKVLAHRDRLLGTMPGREARVHAKERKVPMYQRLAYVSYYGTLLTFTVTSVRAQSARCDAVAERFFGSLKFKKLG
jgi:hypothetical protein